MEFNRTIYVYLRLEKLLGLIEGLNRLIEKQKEGKEKKHPAGEIDEKRIKIERELKELNKKLEFILKGPPWGESELPTSEQIKEKIKDLVTQSSKEIKQAPPEGLSDKELIGIAEKMVTRIIYI